ncbi:hypothetical protein LTR27_004971 [Elasticomyces elasticus]|nr:hypothetical protein LTR27_004971 [Elasticomyces elasticus]
MHLSPTLLMPNMQFFRSKVVQDGMLALYTRKARSNIKHGPEYVWAFGTRDWSRSSAKLQGKTPAFPTLLEVIQSTPQPLRLDSGLPAPVLAIMEGFDFTEEWKMELATFYFIFCEVFGFEKSLVDGLVAMFDQYLYGWNPDDIHVESLIWFLKTLGGVGLAQKPATRPMGPQMSSNNSSNNKGGWLASDAYDLTTTTTTMKSVRSAA